MELPLSLGKVTLKIRMPTWNFQRKEGPVLGDSWDFPSQGISKVRRVRVTLRCLMLGGVSFED